MARVTEARSAQNFLIAIELARCGAVAPVVGQLTGFCARLARRVVKEHGGERLVVRRTDAFRWFDADPQRMLHGTFFLNAYERQVGKMLPGQRLLSSFHDYRRLTEQPILDINSAFDIVRLYRSGAAWFRTCPKCGQQHVTVSARRPECSQCQGVTAMFCKGCHRVMPPRDRTEKRGRPREYCDHCDSRRIARQRRVGRSGALSARYSIEPHHVSPTVDFALRR